MKYLAIARRYAKALLILGKEDGQAQTYREELKNFVQLLESEKYLEEVISNPLYTAENRKKVLKSIIEKLELSPVMASFLLLVFDKGRIRYIKEINKFYERMTDEIANIARATMISATTLPSDTVEKIKSSLERMTGKKIVLEIQEDSSLIGGVVTKVGDLVLDGSVRMQLEKLKDTLKRGDYINAN